MRMQRFPALTACLALATLSAPALAHDREGAYVFAGIGAANTEWKTKAAATPAGQPRTTRDGTASYQLGAGYRFGDYVGVEVGFTDMVGKVRREGVGTVDGMSLGVGVVGYLPIGTRLEAFAKAGVGTTRYRVQSDIGRAAPRAVRATSTALLVGVGANYHVNSTLALRLEASALGASGKGLRDAIDADALATGQWTVGLNYRF
ncbi:porin family protein [Stenotrophomonas sp. LGBM10]|uniref:porin family protein n=1 Tax=Stenotrophomonas sp. LGBM10 TaxID=3390038 RepID=UPI00398AB269